MGLIFRNDEPPQLDAHAQECARKLAVSRMLANHQAEFDKHYAEIYDMRLREETDKLKAMSNISIKITDEETEALYEAIKISLDKFNELARNIWGKQGHNATEDATFQVQRQGHWPSAILMKMNAPV